MNATAKRLVNQFPVIAASAVLMYFIPALAALGAVVYLVRVTLSTSPVAKGETTSDPRTSGE